MIEWQTIDTAPKDGTQIITWNGKTVQAGAWIAAKDDKGHVGWCYAGFDYGGILYDLHYAFEANELPTHWMPLPPPP